MSRQDLLIRSVMTPFPRSIGVDQTLQTAQSMMKEYEIRHLPVQEGGELVGILSDGDISYALAVDKKDPDQLTVEDAYTAGAYVVSPEETVKIVSETMAKESIGCCLITEDGALVGIFSTVDACRCLAEVL